MLEKAAEFIVSFEGLRLDPYFDSSGYVTVGVGHLLTKDKNAKLSDFPSITREEATKQFEEHLIYFSNEVKKLFPNIRNENKLVALTSFAFNLGTGALERSELRRMILNDEHMSEIAREWLTWRKSSGRITLGLERRRLAEVWMYYKDDMPF